MSTYSARVRVEDGMLHTSRPLTAPDPVGDMIDSVVFTMTQDGGAAGVTSVELEVETSGESETPIGDSTLGTSSTPLPPDPDLDGPLPADSVDEPAPAVAR